MLEKVFLSVVSFFTLVSYAHAEQSDYITYEWLTDMARNTNYTDHIPHWRRLFNTMKVRGFLECGCGFSTAYFLDHADKVISIEYISQGYSLNWYQDCLQLYSDRTNWIPMLYNENFRSNSFINACNYQCSTHQDYALIDATYLKELYQHFKILIHDAQAGGYEIDVAFVDPGIFIRGDMVKLLLGLKVPIVAAHDTDNDCETDLTHYLYGWNKVSSPSTHVKIHIPFGKGTTFWISNQLPAVINSMQQYRDSIIQMKALGLSLDYGDLTEIADTMPTP